MSVEQDGADALATALLLRAAISYPQEATRLRKRLFAQVLDFPEASPYASV